MFKKLSDLRWLYASFFMALVLFLSSCSDDDTTNPTVQISEVDSVIKYFETNGDLLNTAFPTIISAADLKTAIAADPAKVALIDIRDTAAYNTGHIQGAVRVDFANLGEYTKALNPANYTKVVIVCFSGQTAAYGTALLRLMGYNNVFSLKWGMSSWSSTFKSTWANKISNSKATQFVNTDFPKNTAGNYPTLSTGKKTAKEIVEARIAELFTKGFTPVTITADQAFTDLATSKNYVINYWPNAQYLDPGHIPSAVNYVPKSDLKSTTFLKTLPTDKPIVIYCYTGMTSAYVSAYLRILGYDAKTLLYGGNGMIYDIMAAKTGFTIWKDSECMDYEIVK
jgi:rhodanese-related sulfurtransferase